MGTSQLPPLLLTVWTRNLERRTLSSSILEVELSMFPFSLLITVYSRSFLLLVILILVEKILIRELPSISSRFSKRKITDLISKKTQEHSRSLEMKLRKPREIYPVSIRSLFQLKVLWMELTSLRPLPELDSKNFAQIFSRKLSSQFNRFLMMLV